MKPLVKGSTNNILTKEEFEKLETKIRKQRKQELEQVEEQRKKLLTEK